MADDLSSSLSGTSNPPNGGQVSSTMEPMPNEIGSPSPRPNTTPDNSINDIRLQERPVPSLPLGTGAAPAPEAAAKQTMGHAIGSIFSGLQGNTSSYQVDPATGKMQVTQQKTPIGQWARGILAAGLAGAGGIGNEQGEHTFAQGLLAGLSGGAKARQSQAEQDNDLKQKQAQQDYANQLKAQEGSRQDKELTLKEQMNKAAIASYTAEAALTGYKLVQAHNQDQLSGAQVLVALDAPKKKIFDEAGVTPLKQGIHQDEYQKLIKDPNSGINANNSVPFVVGHDYIQHADGSIGTNPIIDVYPPTKKVGPELLNQLKEAGYKETDSVYKEAQSYVGKNGVGGKDIEPTKLVTMLNEITKGFDFQKQNLEAKKDQAQIAASYATQNAEQIRGKLASFELTQQKEALLGQQLSQAPTSPNGVSYVDPEDGKTKVGKISPNSNGGYDFENISPRARASLASYYNLVGQQAQLNLDKNAKAQKDDPEDPNLKLEGRQLAQQVSSITGLFNATSGLKLWPGNLGGTTTQIGKLAQHFGQGLNRDASVVYSRLVGSGLPLEDVLSDLSKAPLAHPEDKAAVLNAVQNFYKEATPILTQQQDASKFVNSQIDTTINQIKKDNFDKKFGPNPSGPITAFGG